MSCSPVKERCGVCSCCKVQAQSSHPCGQDVIYEPLAPVLPDCGIAQQPGGDEHLVRRLQHPLQVRRIPLRQGKLLSELSECYPPGEISFLPGDLEEPVEAPRHGR